MHGDFCVAVKRLARLQSTIRQYNVRDTPGAVSAGVEEEEEEEGWWPREGIATTKGVDFEQTLKSRQFQRGRPRHTPRAVCDGPSRVLSVILTLVYRGGMPPPSPSRPPRAFNRDVQNARVHFFPRVPAIRPDRRAIRSARGGANFICRRRVDSIDRRTICALRSIYLFVQAFIAFASASIYRIYESDAPLLRTDSSPECLRSELFDERGEHNPINWTSLCNKMSLRSKTSFLRKVFIRPYQRQQSISDLSCANGIGICELSDSATVLFGDFTGKLNFAP